MVGRWLRFWRIIWVALYYGLDDVLLRAAGFTYLRHLLNGLFFFAESMPCRACACVLL